jgi:hypothetical protein
MTSFSPFLEVPREKVRIRYYRQTRPATSPSAAAHVALLALNNHLHHERLTRRSRFQEERQSGSLTNSLAQVPCHELTVLGLLSRSARPTSLLTLPLPSTLARAQLLPNGPRPYATTLTSSSKPTKPPARQEATSSSVGLLLLPFVPLCHLSPWLASSPSSPEKGERRSFASYKPRKEDPVETARAASGLVPNNTFFPLP